MTEMVGMVEIINLIKNNIETIKNDLGTYFECIDCAFLRDELQIFLFQKQEFHFNHAIWIL